jgi:hypothetical protein
MKKIGKNWIWTFVKRIQFTSSFELNCRLNLFDCRLEIVCQKRASDVTEHFEILSKSRLVRSLWARPKEITLTDNNKLWFPLCNLQWMVLLIVITISGFRQNIFKATQCFNDLLTLVKELRWFTSFSFPPVLTEMACSSLKSSLYLRLSAKLRSDFEAECK